VAAIAKPQQRPGTIESHSRAVERVIDAMNDRLEDSFTLDPLIGVIGMMGDKDAEGLLAAFEPHLEHVVVTQNSTERALPAAELAEVAVEVFGEDRVTVEPRLADAIDLAAGLAEAGGGASIGSGGVLVTGSVVTVGEARAMLRRRA